MKRVLAIVFTISALIVNAQNNNKMESDNILTNRQLSLDAEGLTLKSEFPKGDPNVRYAQFFTGNSYLAPLKPKNLTAGEATVQGYSNVTFEPGCRNNWHIHHGAHQILICVSGRGWYQEWGKPAIALNPGDVIDIPEGVKHWHGAQADSWFQHIATHVTTSGEERNEWLEPVTNQHYTSLKPQK